MALSKYAVLTLFLAWYVFAATHLPLELSKGGSPVTNAIWDLDVAKTDSRTKATTVSTRMTSITTGGSSSTISTATTVLPPWFPNATSTNYSPKATPPVHFPPFPDDPFDPMPGNTTCPPSPWNPRFPNNTIPGNITCPPYYDFIADVLRHIKHKERRRALGIALGVGLGAGIPSAALLGYGTGWLSQALLLYKYPNMYGRWHGLHEVANEAALELHDRLLGRSDDVVDVVEYILERGGSSMARFGFLQEVAHIDPGFGEAEDLYQLMQRIMAGELPRPVHGE